MRFFSTQAIPYASSSAARMFMIRSSLSVPTSPACIRLYCGRTLAGRFSCVVARPPNGARKHQPSVSHQAAISQSSVSSRSVCSQSSAKQPPVTHPPLPFRRHSVISQPSLPPLRPRPIVSQSSAPPLRPHSVINQSPAPPFPPPLNRSSIVSPSPPPASLTALILQLLAWLHNTTHVSSVISVGTEPCTHAYAQ